MEDNSFNIYYCQIFALSRGQFNIKFSINEGINGSLRLWPMGSSRKKWQLQMWGTLGQLNSHNGSPFWIENNENDNFLYDFPRGSRLCLILYIWSWFHNLSILVCIFGQIFALFPQWLIIQWRRRLFEQDAHGFQVI